MSSDELFQTMRDVSLHSPAAVLTTMGLNGLRSRLVHPLWDTTGWSGYVLTDKQSPKVADLDRSAQVALTYQLDNMWLLASADTVVNPDRSAVSFAVTDCSSRADGYLPADFWNDEELARLVVIKLSLAALEMARFNGAELEVKRWRRRTANPGLS